MQEASEQVVLFITTYGIKIIGAIIILIIGRFAAGMGRKILKGALEKRDVDPSIVSFVASLTYVLILTFTVLAALAKFGIQTRLSWLYWAQALLPSALPCKAPWPILRQAF